MQSHPLFLPGPQASTSLAQSSSAVTSFLLLFAISHLNYCNHLLPILPQFSVHPAPRCVSDMQWNYITLLIPFKTLTPTPHCHRLLLTSSFGPFMIWPLPIPPVIPTHILAVPRLKHAI